MPVVVDEGNTGAGMKKLLITGCEGLLGQNLLSIADRTRFELVGFDLAEESMHAGLTYRQVDLTNADQLCGAVKAISPDVILNTAAMTAVDRCETEPESCFAINTHAVESLASVATEIEANLVQLSTDYVFPGTDGPYRETDLTDPLSVYGKSKLYAEQAVSALGQKALVVRTVVLFGHGEKLTSSFVTWLINSLREGKEVRIVDDQVSNVTLASDLAHTLLDLIELDAYGVYHASSRDRMSRYQFALEIAEKYGLDRKLISPVSTSAFNQPAPRPLQGGFVVEKLESRLGRQMLTVSECIDSYYKADQGSKG